MIGIGVAVAPDDVDERLPLDPGDSSAPGTRGPSTSMTSSMSTSRRVPLKVTPTCGDPVRRAGGSAFVGAST